MSFCMYGYQLLFISKNNMECVLGFWLAVSQIEKKIIGWHNIDPQDGLRWIPTLKKLLNVEFLCKNYTQNNR